MFRIKEILKNTEIDGKKATVAWLAEKVGTPQPHLSNIINGNANASIEMLNRIAEVLNVEVWELFEKKIKDELTAFIDYKGKLYRITSVKELEKLLEEIKKAE